MDRTCWNYRFDDIVIDPRSHRVRRGGTDVALEPKAFALLAVLLDRPGDLIKRDQLLDAVWRHRHVTPATLTRIIALLRKRSATMPTRRAISRPCTGSVIGSSAA